MYKLRLFFLFLQLLAQEIRVIYKKTKQINQTSR